LNVPCADFLSDNLEREGILDQKVIHTEIDKSNAMASSIWRLFAESFEGAEIADRKNMSVSWAPGLFVREIAEHSSDAAHEGTESQTRTLENHKGAAPKLS
jgi:hypothetical protein